MKADPATMATGSSLLPPLPKGAESSEKEVKSITDTVKEVGKNCGSQKAKKMEERAKLLLPAFPYSNTWALINLF